MRGGHGRGSGNPAKYAAVGDVEAPPPKLKSRDLLLVLKSYFWPQGCCEKLMAFLSLFLIAASKSLNIISPLFLGVASNNLIGGRVDWLSIGLYGAASAGSAILREGQNFVYLRVQQTAYVEVATKTFKHLHSLSLNWHLSKKTGSALRSMDRGVESANTVVKYLFMNLVPTIIEALVVCVVFTLRFNNWKLAVTAFGGVFLYAITTYALTMWRNKIRKVANQQDNDAHDKAIDSLVNFETVKYFTNEEFEYHRYKGAMTKLSAANTQTQSSLNILNSLQALIIQGTMVLAMGFTAQAIVNRDMLPGDFVTVIVYVNQMFAPLSFLGTIYSIVVQGFIDMQNLSELLAVSPDVADFPEAKVLESRNPTGPVVEFNNVVFNYPEQPVENGLQGLSFKIESGTTTAIVGHTGAGKSTISRLLFRFYDVKGGFISIDGQHIDHVTQRSLRKLIGIVPQDTVLFNDTMSYNINYGDTKKGEEDVKHAAKLAHIYDFVESLEKGFSTMVGERGLKLSGGEKQRVAIARTLLKNPPLLILDEATSSLDTGTEKQIQEELAHVCKGRTTIIIAHRLSTVVNAEQILVMDKGTIIERGTHAELLRLEGAYHKLWQKQTSGEGESKVADADALEKLVAPVVEVPPVASGVAKGHGHGHGHGR